MKVFVNNKNCLKCVTNNVKFKIGINKEIVIKDFLHCFLVLSRFKAIHDTLVNTMT